jgi:hypothetical protein
MKLSNKILLGFFGFAFLYLTAAFAELRFTGTPNVINSENSKAETADLSGVTYLIVNNVEREITVQGSDRTQLEVRSFSGNALKNLKYSVSGDTLTVSGFESEDTRNVRITLFFPSETLKGITVKSAPVSIEELQQEHLHITQNAGRVWMSGSQITSIDADLSSQSFLSISATVLDTASVKIDQSQLNLSTPVGVVQGSMQNNAVLHVNQIEEIHLKKDKSSNLNVY